MKRAYEDDPESLLLLSYNNPVHAPLDGKKR